MQTLTQWTTRLWSRPSTQATKFSVIPSVCPVRSFSSPCSLRDAQQDSDKRERYLEQMTDYRQRLRQDEAFRKEEQARSQRYWKERSVTDPAWYIKRNRRKRDLKRQRYASDDEYYERERLQQWVTSANKKLREGLTWKTHVPVLYEHKVKHECVGCGYPKFNGMKFCGYAHHLMF